MPNTPKVSVVVPVYNSGDLIQPCIESVLRQDYPNVEVIVVNDASTDKTDEICRQFDSVITYIPLKNNVGGARARNIGANQASGDFIAFFDADDSMYENKLSAQIGAMLRSSARSSYCQAENETGNVIGSGYRDTFWRELLLGECDIVSSSGLVVSSSLHHAVGGFDEDFPRQQDIEYTIRLSKLAPILFIDRPLYLKFNSGSPKLTKVESGIRQLWSKFEEDISALPAEIESRIYARGFARFCELAAVEANFKCIYYGFQAIRHDPGVFKPRFARYIDKFRIALARD